MDCITTAVVRQAGDVSRNDVASRLAGEFGVSRATIFRNAKFASSVDRLGEYLGQSFKTRYLAGNIRKLTSAAVVRLARLDDETLAALASSSDADLVRVSKGLAPAPDRLASCKAAFLRLSADEKSQFAEWVRGLIVRPGGAQ